MRGLRGLAYRVTVPAVRWLNAVARRAVAATHLFQFKLEGALRPDAEWFDHQLDVYWQWPRRNRPSFLERGVLNALCIGEGARVLELCSGDGFYARNFYAPRAREVVAIDANEEGVAYARRVNAAANIEYVHGDVLAPLPPGPFDNVVWDGAIAHFSPSETQQVLTAIAAALRSGGVLSGQTTYESDSSYGFVRQRFPTSASLAEALRPAFDHVCVREHREPGRTNYYFFCSDTADALPFSAGDPAVVRLPPS